MADFDPWAALAAAQSNLANLRSTTYAPCDSSSEEFSDTYNNSSDSSDSRSDTLEVSQSREESRKERKTEDIYILQWLTTDEALCLPPGRPANTIERHSDPARVAILREVGPGYCNQSEIFDSRAAIANQPEIPIPGPLDILRAPLEWREGFARLNPTEAPCPGFTGSMDWRSTYAALHAFLEQHAEQAHTLDWGTLDLFAVHRTVGGTRVDCVGGALLAGGNRVSAVEPDAIHFARLRDGQPAGRFRRVPIKPEMTPVWEFGQ